MSNDIVVVSGKLPLDELNKCLSTTGYCKRLPAVLAALASGDSHA